LSKKLNAMISLAILLVSSNFVVFQVHAAAPTDTFAVGWNGPPMDTINPMLVTVYDGGAYMVNHAMYDKLVQADSNGDPAPDLADSWEWKDAQTVVFHLVRNATWHDGVPFTAADAEFTINLIVANKDFFPLMRTYVTSVDSAKALDDYTLQINLKNPDAKFLQASLIMTYIVPKHIWEKVGNYTSYANENPIGTGPFKFVRWEPNSFVEFDANPDYFRGPPHVKHLTMRYFSSVNAMILALQSGEIHATGPILPPTVVPLMTSNPGIQVISRPDLRYYYFNFNAFANGTGNPTLRDERVRRALAYAIDKKTLAQTVWQGFADVLNSIMPTALGKWHNPNTPDIPFDLDKAAQMLDEAGYKVGADGIRISPDGVKMIYKIQVPSSYQEELRAAQMVAEWWSKINVKGIPELVEVGALGDIVVNWKHDTFIWVWSATSTDPDDFLLVFTTEQICVPGCMSDSGFSDPEYDQLYQQQLQATDAVQRQQIVWKMQDIVAEHVPYVPLYNNYAIQGFRSDLFTGLPQGIVPPVSQFAGNNLFVNVRPVVPVTTETTQMTTQITTQTTTTQAEVIPTATIAAVIVIVIVLALVGVLLMRRRKPAS